MTTPRFIIALLLVAGFFSVPTAMASDPEQSCQDGRAKAAGRYAQCFQKAVSKRYLTSFDSKKFGKCVTQYTSTYDRLRRRAQRSPAAETCDAVRFVDNGDGTLTDSLSALQWELKTDDAGVHDKDNLYTWSASGTAGDGTLFSTFLAGLNGSGFAGQSDWRVPTEAELLSIVQPAIPKCTTAPCIDPTFGLIVASTVADFYWSSMTDLEDPTFAWLVGFYLGMPYPIFIPTKTGSAYARAVRGGL